MRALPPVDVNRLTWARRFADRDTVCVDHFRGRRAFPAHAHDYLEVVVVTGGGGTHRGEHGDSPLSRGCVVLLRPGAWHAYRLGPDREGIDLWDCCIESSLLARELAWLFEVPELARLLWGGSTILTRLPEAAMAQAELLLAQLTAASNRDGPSRVERIAVLARLLALLARHLPADAEVRPVHPAVATVLHLFEERPADPWTMSGLALRTGTTPTYLSRVFRAATGMPPVAWLHRRRCELAARLLRSTCLPVATIAARVGWSDANCFARRFRSRYGLSASAWRQQHAGAADQSPAGGAHGTR